jgi:hypothetical protein
MERSVCGGSNRSPVIGVQDLPENLCDRSEGPTAYDYVLGIAAKRLLILESDGQLPLVEFLKDRREPSSSRIGPRDWAEARFVYPVVELERQASRYDGFFRRFRRTTKKQDGQDSDGKHRRSETVFFTHSPRQR